MAKMPDPAKQFAEQAVKARADFDRFDAETNESINRTMKAYAKLAEEKPEELFGLKPTERERFFVSRLLDPAVLRAGAVAQLTGTSGPDAPLDDAVEFSGENPALIAGAIAKILSSDGGAKVIEEFLHHIREEKKFFKETGEDIIGWLFGGE